MSETQVVEKSTRPRWFLPVLVAAAVVAAALGATYTLGAVQLAAGPGTFTAKGGVLISGTTCDSIPLGYDDLTAGAGVTVKDPSGKTVALGTLTEGKDIGDFSCAFLFNVKEVPAGLGIYGIEVTHRGLLQYKEAKLRKDGAVMELSGY